MRLYVYALIVLACIASAVTAQCPCGAAGCPCASFAPPSYYYGPAAGYGGGCTGGAAVGYGGYAMQSYYPPAVYGGQGYAPYQGYYGYQPYQYGSCPGGNCNVSVGYGRRWH
jgi:hypothetical protein